LPASTSYAWRSPFEMLRNNLSNMLNLITFITSLRLDPISSSSRQLRFRDRVAWAPMTKVLSSAPEHGLGLAWNLVGTVSWSGARKVLKDRSQTAARSHNA